MSFVRAAELVTLKKMGWDFPEHYVFVASTDAGDMICLDVSNVSTWSRNLSADNMEVMIEEFRGIHLRCDAVGLL